MAPRYAQDTSVSVSRTMDEIRGMLRKYGASAVGVLEGEHQAQILFEAQGRKILFRLTLPKREAYRETPGKRLWRDDAAMTRAWEQACRSRWRALLLCIHAKLEAVEAGIETFEEAFLAHVVLPSGHTVYEEIQRPLALNYERGDVAPLLGLPAPKGGRDA